MIARSDILSIPFLKKSPFTGSFQGMRYRMELVEEEDTKKLLVQLWEGPYAFEAVSEDKCQREEFSFDEEGICRSVDWLNQCWSREEERWRKAQSQW